MSHHSTAASTRSTKIFGQDGFFSHQPVDVKSATAESPLYFRISPALYTFSFPLSGLRLASRPPPLYQSSCTIPELICPTATAINYRAPPATGNKTKTSSLVPCRCAIVMSRLDLLDDDLGSLGTHLQTELDHGFLQY